VENGPLLAMLDKARARFGLKSLREVKESGAFKNIFHQQKEVGFETG
jgi:hypothetical protein